MRFSAIQTLCGIHTIRRALGLVKRYGNLYNSVYDMQNLELAHKHAKKGKGWYREVKQLERNLKGGLRVIRHLLLSHDYKTSDYEMFLKQEGDKVRNIYKLPYFPDRVVQWALMQVVSPYIEKHLIRDTYSAIPNRGIHDGLRRVQKVMYTKQDECRFCWKFDVRHYYQRIVHEILFAQYCRMFKDVDLLWLIYEIIGSINTIDQEDVEEMQARGLEVNLACGVPIGNYFSQWSGNFYLSPFDHWIKEQMGVKHFYRYMDDGVVFHNDKDFLHELKDKSSEFIWNELRLNFKDNWQIFPTYVRGVDYLGYRIFDNYTLLRKKTTKNIKQSCKRIGTKVRNGNLMSYSDFCSLNSHMGWVESGDCFRFGGKYLMPLADDACRFYMDEIWAGDYR